MPTETNRHKDFTTAKALVREWLLEKGIALTGVNGEASHSTVNRFKLDLQSRIVDALNAERESCVKIVNDARFEGGVDLRELVSRIRSGVITNAD